MNSAFEAVIARDLTRTFLSPTGEFTVPVTIGGVTVQAVVDDSADSFASASLDGFRDASGIAVVEMRRTVRMAASALSRPPLPEQDVLMDGERWTVTGGDGAVRVEHGLLVFSVSRPTA